MPAPHPPPPLADPGLLGIAQLMPILDLTVVAVALPNLSPDLGMGRQQLTGVVSGDTLAFGGLVLLGGRAADLFGARRLLITGLGLFAGASLVAGLAPTGGPCWPAASCQGAAAAVLSPSALSLVVQRFDGPERERALASGRPWGGGPALGLAAGRAAPPPARAGPGCCLSTCPSGSRSPQPDRVRPRDAAGRPRGRLELLGAALVTAATGTLIQALVQAGDRGWASAASGVLAVMAAGRSWAFVVQSATRPIR